MLGLIVTIGLYYAIRRFYASGLLLPMGYGQGPGQAYNWGHNYEIQWGFENGTSFGLAVAAMGFVSASVGGVIYLNRLRRKGIFQGQLGEDAKDNVTLSTFTGDNEVPISESMDKFTIQLALVFLAYALAFLFMKGVNSLLDPRRNGREGSRGNGAEHDLGLPVPFQQRFRHAHQSGDEGAAQKGRHAPRIYEQLSAKPHRGLYV